MSEKKEYELKMDELKLEKEYDITIRMLKSAQAQMSETMIWWEYMCSMS